MRISNIKKILIIIVAIIWGAIAAWYFMLSLSDIQTHSTNEHLSTIAASNAADVRFVFDRHIRTLNAVTKSIENSDELRSPRVLSTLNSISEEDSFLRLAIDDTSGISYTSDGDMY